MESNTFSCQVVVVRENSRVWSRAGEQFLPYSPKQNNNSLNTLTEAAHEVVISVTHRCEDVRPPEEDEGRGAPEAHHAV